VRVGPAPGVSFVVERGFVAGCRAEPDRGPRTLSCHLDRRHGRPPILAFASVCL
jgi:hypothetical protein